MELDSLKRDQEQVLSSLRRALEESERFAAEHFRATRENRDHELRALKRRRQCREGARGGGRVLNRLTAERGVEMQKASQAIEEASPVLDAQERESREIAPKYKCELRAREELRVMFEGTRDNSEGYREPESCNPGN
jgi:hypothetical protein